MNFISIHDTHRLPYFNAVITAKTKQSGNTSPLKFRTCLDGTELGYEVRTNARGYLCDHDGNLYTDGVCVGEDAYITAVLPDGTSTSWVVCHDSDITVNDGMLLGKVVSESEKVSGKQYALVEGVWRVVLHSANTPDNRTLPLADLDEVPAFNEWKEVQEVVRFNSQNTSYDIGEYAKSLVIQWEGNLPAYPEPITITLGYENANNRKRYAQQVMVGNSLSTRIRLRDKSSGEIICYVPAGEVVDIGLFFTQNASVGNWRYDGPRPIQWNLVSTQGWGTDLGASGKATVAITDRTPDIIHLVMREGAKIGGNPKRAEIPVVLTIPQGLSEPRDIYFWFTNESTSTAATLPAVLKRSEGSGEDIAIVYSGQMVLLHIPGTRGSVESDDKIVLLDNALAPYNRAVTLSLAGGGSFYVPRRCDYLILLTPGNKEVINLQFPTNFEYYTKVRVQCMGSHYTTLNLLNDSNHTLQHKMLISGGATFGVRNTLGSLYVDGKDVEGSYSYAGDGDWYADFTNKYANKIDFTELGGKTGKRFGSWEETDAHCNRLYIKLPFQETDSENFEVVLTGYKADLGSNRYLKIEFVTTDHWTYDATNLFDITDDGYINGGRYRFAKNLVDYTRVYY